MLHLFVFRVSYIERRRFQCGIKFYSLPLKLNQKAAVSDLFTRCELVPPSYEWNRQANNCYRFHPECHCVCIWQHYD